MSSFDKAKKGKYFIDRDDSGTKDGTCVTSTTDECFVDVFGNYAEGDLKGQYKQIGAANGAMVAPFTRAPVDFAAGLKNFGSEIAMLQQVDATIAGVMRDCGECHVGGGAMEYIPMKPGTNLVAATADGTRQDLRTWANPENEYNAYTYFVDQYDEDNDGIKGELLRADYANSGVMEVDCLMCHMDGYSWKDRTDVIREGKLDTSRVVGAGLGTDAYVGEAMGTNYGKTVAYNTEPGDSLEQVAWGSWNLLKFTDIGKDSILGTPPDANCKSCHFDMHQVDWKKRGTSWAGNYMNEVHSSIGCMGCHERKDDMDMDGGDETWTGAASSALGHDPAKGNAPYSSLWNNTDNTVKTCANCHVDQIANNFNAVDPTSAHAALGLTSIIGQKGRDGVRNANHLDFISCEGCHTRKLGRGPSVAEGGDTHGSLYEWGTGGAMVDSTGPDHDGRLTDHENLYVERTMENNMTVSWMGGKLRSKHSLITMFWRDKHDNFANGGDPAFFDVNADGQTGSMDAVNPFHVRTAMAEAGLHVLTADGVIDPTEIGAQQTALFNYLTKDDGTLPGTIAGDGISDTNGRPFTMAAEGSTLGSDWVKGKLKLSFMGVVFLANHNTSPKDAAWGAGGCTDCHGEGAGFYNGAYELKGRDLDLAWDNTSPTGENKWVVPFTKVNKANYSGRTDTDVLPLGNSKADWQFTDYHPTLFAKGLKGRSIAVKAALGGSDTLRTIDRSELIYEGDSTVVGGPGARVMVDGTIAGTRAAILASLNSAGGVGTGAHAVHASAHMGECASCHYDVNGAGNISDTYAVNGDFVWTPASAGAPATCSTNACHAANDVTDTTEWVTPPDSTVTVVANVVATPVPTDNYITYSAEGSTCEDTAGPITCTYDWNVEDGLGLVMWKSGATIAESDVIRAKYDARGEYRAVLTMTGNGVESIDSIVTVTNEKDDANPATAFSHTMDPLKRAMLYWTGVAAERMEILWADGQSTVIVDPAADGSLMHAYGDAGSYAVKVVTLDEDHDVVTYDLEMNTL